jgi:hypothetical protein
MAIQNRTVTIKNIFAENANTTIPNPPVSDVSYRNTTVTADEIGEGWPYKKIVDSAKFNEAMYEYTTICKQLEKYGFLPWCADTDYPAGGCALGTDGNVYQAKVATGPSSTAADPVSDTSHTYWDLFYYSSFTANCAIASNANGKLTASSTTSTELGYVHGVTSAIQTQLNAKATPANITSAINTLLATLYPVNSFYIGAQSTCPLASLISGSTWSKVGTAIVTNVDSSVPVKGTGKSMGITGGADTDGNVGVTGSWVSGTGGSGDKRITVVKNKFNLTLNNTSYETTNISGGRVIGLTNNASNSGIVGTASSTKIKVNIWKRTA